jgi:hypothetical protein
VQAKQTNPNVGRRPKLLKVKDKILLVCFTMAEVERLNKAAKSSDPSVLEWIRSTVLNGIVGGRGDEGNLRM